MIEWKLAVDDGRTVMVLGEGASIAWRSIDPLNAVRIKSGVRRDARILAATMRQPITIRANDGLDLEEVTPAGDARRIGDLLSP